MTQVTVVDSIMGSGKTTWCIDYINQHEDDNIVYITPFLKEADRIAEGCKSSHDFRRPVNKGNGKLCSLNEMLQGENDIAATHELFKHLDAESKEYIKAGHYTLILDETLNVIEPLDLKKSDVPLLKQGNCIDVDEEGFVIWNEKADIIDSRYNDIKTLAEKHLLMYINNTMLVWRYPPEIFGLFDKVFVLTYMFDASVMSYYFKAYNIRYDKRSVRFNDCGKPELIEYQPADTSKFKDLIHIYEGNCNENFYQKTTSLSASWFDSSASSKYIKKIKNNIYNYFQHIVLAKSKTIMWTTFKKSESKLQGKGYTKCFVSCNCRSTNEYGDRYNLAYVVNVYVHPAIIQFFSAKHIQVDQDKYALSEMIQWIWRSRIRNDKDINIYIPSKRMRELLRKWLK